MPALRLKKSQNKYAAHEPVLADEVIDALHIKKSACAGRGSRIIDATIGAGGHAIEIIKAGGEVLGIDADEAMLGIAKKKLGGADSFKLVHANFKEIDSVAKAHGFEKVDGILMDLGVSSIHLSDFSRSFSFQSGNAPLDMRIDIKHQGLKASDLLNGLRKDQLLSLFRKVLGFNESTRLVAKIINFRQTRKFKSVSDFLEVIPKSRSGKIHPATKPFLALRMAVNSELENLTEALPKAFPLLNPGGRLVVISFHSGEDKLVKHFFKNKVDQGLADLITKKPLKPSEDELEKNPRARSACLRVLKKK